MPAIIDRLRSVWGTAREEAESEDSGDSERRPSSLFHCPRCDVVYLATEKSTCSGCGGAVERVPRSSIE